MDIELNAPEQFTLCNNEKCSTKFKYLDYSIHTVVDGPDPRDHLANERNLLTWIRTGTTLSLIDLPSKNFAPSYSLPWTNDPVSFKIHVVAYIFVALGFICFIFSLYNYFRNQQHIVKRLLWVGHGWIGYTVATLMMLFAVFIMIMALVSP
ncbi:hypothetical protein BD560DRAFT_440784 [Blakeslea trispora]|nr:hypothetical protein BD560DRAFT_440784 [Blakeslea trispora]